jgi:hypothetical protein
MTEPRTPGPASSLTIITRQPMLGAFVAPKAEINGHTINLSWGVNTFPAPRGVHHITLYMPWLWRFGKAQITVDNTASEAPPVYYAPPYTTFNAGAVAHQPVKAPGLLAFLLILGVPLALLVVCCGASLLSDGA